MSLCDDRRCVCPRFIRFVVVCLLAFPSLALSVDAAQERPNILLIYADDLGFGDVGCYGATGMETPHLDALAARGLRMTDAHAPAATCTPSRFSLLTGQYAFRNQRARILPGNAVMLIEPGTFTLPVMLKQAGYATAVVGKWHLGLGDGNLDWNGRIAPGPLEIGFDYAFLLPATGDRVPCVYVENHHVVDLDPSDPIVVSYQEPLREEPLGRDHPELLKQKPSHGHDQTIINGISRIGYMSGGKSARWVDENMADEFVRRAVKWLENHDQQQPFFMFFSTHDIHVPRVPHARFVGSSKSGLRGDATQQLDWCIGQLVETLDRLGMTDNTLIMVTSDNGPVVDDGYHDGAVENLGDHRPAGPYRGGKYSNFEAGTRVPWINVWPGKIEPGTSKALVSQVDLLGSLASLVGQTLPDAAGPDSFDVLPALLGQSSDGRRELVEQASTLSLRRDTWKFIPAHRGPAVNRNVNIELGNFGADQLFDLSADPGEANNVAPGHPELVAEMKQTLARLREEPKSRP